MTDMLAQLLVTITVMVVLLAGWVLVQRMIAGGPDRRNCDPLEGRWGCAGCILTGHCSKET
jgi:hypothetical protein